MKILSEQNKSNLLANGSNQNIIVSLNLDTKIEKSLSLNNEPVHYCFLLDISDSSQNNNECNIENSKLNKIKVVLKSFVENTLPLFRDEDKISMFMYFIRLLYIHFSKILITMVHRIIITYIYSTIKV